jgi:hypothetical protein
MHDHPTAGGPIEIKRAVDAILTGGPPHDSLQLAGVLNIHANSGQWLQNILC